MISISNNSQCCGCTACACVCPRQCISMISDTEGFRVPFVNSEQCVNCGACDKVCPLINGYERNTVLKAFVARNKNEKTLLRSTSGGFFSALACSVIQRGGYAYGAVCDNNKKIKHIGTNNINEIVWFSGSKYVQSDLSGVFFQVKQLLDQGTEVVFSGTSCQIAGLNNFLKREHPNLLTIEVICHGVPSPFLWDKYVEYQEKKHRSQIKTVNFRNKTYGYHSGTMTLEFENGVTYSGSARVDYLLKAFFSEISSRQSCYSCPFKGKERPADISVFDCWHASSLVSGLVDDDRGYTNVLANSEKGISALRSIEHLVSLKEISPEKAIALDGVMILKQPIAHKNRKDFYAKIVESDLATAINTYIPVTFKDKAVEGSKGILYKVGLLQILKRRLKNKR